MKSCYKKCFSVGLVLVMAALQVQAQEYRTINGQNNNPNHSDWGAAGIQLINSNSNGYSDGVSEPGGLDRPNPRVISNILFSQNATTNDSRGLSAFCWVWGQFIDHDVTLVPDHPTENVDVAVPPFDFFFDPAGTGNVKIHVLRSKYDPATGTDPSNPRTHVNEITSFIDGSGVYGSDPDRLNWLRLYSQGKLRLSNNNLLPFNTITGEYAAPIDPAVPGMAMPLPFVQKWFVAGDVRANENPFLVSMHTLFVREHNRICQELSLQHPTWEEDELFQEARRRVGAIIQAITYEEWLPTLGVHLPAYTGYQPAVNPGIENIFSAAAFRYGHTTINNMLLRMDNEGHYVPNGNVLLRDAFFNPQATLDVNGIEPYLIGMSTVIQQENDCKVIDDLRNFLFGPPGAGGLDLVSINIQRARERGIPDYNTVRTDIGLPPAQTFMDLTSDMLMFFSLQNLYGDISKLDPWVGMLAEDHMSDALFGPTSMAYISRQFKSLRDGDRFYFENDPAFTSQEKEAIKNTRLADVIRRNTPVTSIHDNIFMAQPLTTAANEPGENRGNQLSVFPNPFTGSGTLQLDAPTGESALLRIVDPLGRLIVSETIQLQAGPNQLPFELSRDMPAGRYHIQLTGGNIRAQAAVVKM